MSASADNTYIYLSGEGTIIGFGQILLRDDHSVHLARLIVNPKLRGKGVGRSLCVALIKMGAAKHAPKVFTLNVYRSNKTAIGLYRSLGFTVQSHGDGGIVAMVKALRAAASSI
ncbi:MAG: GNAT family N-acetyltransferase [Idiomarina sp.]|nr:GNAT family N-acetyltransferase [Idiomarina sp.]